MVDDEPWDDPTTPTQAARLERQRKLIAVGGFFGAFGCFIGAAYLALGHWAALLVLGVCLALLSAGAIGLKGELPDSTEGEGDA